VSGDKVMDIKVSETCYNEIANALDRLGKKVEPGAKITIEKNDKIINPIDLRAATMRRDAAQIAQVAYRSDITNTTGQVSANPQSFVEFCNEIYQFILKGEYQQVSQPTAAKKEWK
jgi:hypothetical protein